MTVFCRAVSPPPSISTTAVSPVRTPHTISTARCGASEPPEVIMLSTWCWRPRPEMKNIRTRMIAITEVTVANGKWSNVAKNALLMSAAVCLAMSPPSNMSM